jgi:hypothetical protein
MPRETSAAIGALKRRLGLSPAEYRRGRAPRQRSPGLSLAGLDERPEAADEMPPALHDRLGRVSLPAAVLERDLGDTGLTK